MRPRPGTCRGCGRPVVFAQSIDGPNVVLEPHESPAGPDRYAVWDDGLARPVARRSQVLAMPEHRCDGRDQYDRDREAA